MSARCSLIVNGKAVRVSTGDTPVEAALAEGMIAPLQALHGAGLLGQGPGAAARRTKSRRTRTDVLKLAASTAAPIVAAEPRRVPSTTRKGTLSGLRVLSPHVVEAVVTLEKRLVLEPGHQVALSIEGLSPVTLCPTLRVDGSAELNEAVFHCPRDEDGPSLFEAVGLEVAVKLKGPVEPYFRAPEAPTAE